MPLRELLKKKDKVYSVNHGDVASIFCNIELLEETHRSWKTKLEQLNEKWPAIDTIGQLFIDMVSISIFYLTCFYIYFVIYPG